MKEQTRVRSAKSALGLRAAFRGGSMTARPGTAAARSEWTKTSMSLSAFNDEWSKFLETEKCPPILGLVPLSDGDCAELSRLLAAEFSRLSFLAPCQVLLRLLDQFPAILAIWISRKAGEAYDAGAFWDQFREKTGVGVAVTQRPGFTVAFLRACRKTMSNFTAPAVVMRPYVDEFLFQAGLPLCHCEIYVRALRSVAADCGLPVPDDLDAVEDLRSALLARSELAVRRIVQRALEGPAGLFILEVTLRVVRDEDFGSINPQLGERLREFFATHARHMTGTAVRWPFLRLGENCVSLEVVGPQQPSGVIGASGFCWSVNGTRFRTAAADEFIYPVRNEKRAVVELLGLRSGRSLRREFDLCPADGQPPFFLFPAATQKQWRGTVDANACQLPCGDYWLVHATEHTLDGPTTRLDWEHNFYATSLLKLRPGSDFALTNSDGEDVCRFRPAVLPFVEVSGDSLLTNDGLRIHYAWHELPTVWLPETEAESVGDWTLQAAFNDFVGEWELLPKASGTKGKMFSCVPQAGEFPGELPPAMYEVRFEVLRRGHRQCSQTLWLWHGLTSAGDNFFQWAVAPANLTLKNCEGFQLVGNQVHHTRDNSSQHCLRFEIGGIVRTFRWSPPGVFVESFLRFPGKAIQPQAHKLGETFSASVGTPRCLRVAHVPAVDAELLVNGQVHQRLNAGLWRGFVDVRLDSLATTHPQGGSITLRRGGIDVPVAEFTRPLVPLIIEYTTDENYESLLCKFNDDVRWVRPRVYELISGQLVEFDGRRFGTSGHCLFHNEGLPTLECASIAKDIFFEARLYRITLDVPRTGWPEGVWLIELDVRRDDTSEWQPLTDDRGGRLPVIVLQPPAATPESYRAQCLWWAFGEGLAVETLTGRLPPSTGNEKQLCELLGEIGDWLGRGFSAQAWFRLRCLEVFFGELAKQAAWLLQNESERISEPLLAAAAREEGANPARSLFVAVPNLLALPAEQYCVLNNTDALRGSLLWCAEIATAPRVADAFRDLFFRVQLAAGSRIPGLFSVLQHFRNFASAVQQQARSGDPADFRGFDYQRYFGVTIGPLNDLPSGTDWSEAEALTRVHVQWALMQLQQRRDRSEGGSLAEANQVFSAATDLQAWLVPRLSERTRLMPTSIWAAPWFDVDLPDDALTTSCARFASLFALVARTAAAGWIPFGDVLVFLSHRHGRSAVAKAVTTLVRMAPELFGYHLMFWELMVRTYPHE